MSPANIEAKLKAASPADRAGDRDRRRQALQRRADHARPRRGARLRAAARPRRAPEREVERGVEAANEQLARVEQIKKFTLLDDGLAARRRRADAHDEAEAQADPREVRGRDRGAVLIGCRMERRVVRPAWPPTPLRSPRSSPRRWRCTGEHVRRLITGGSGRRSSPRTPAPRRIAVSAMARCATGARRGASRVRAPGGGRVGVGTLIVTASSRTLPRWRRPDHKTSRGHLRLAAARVARLRGRPHLSRNA